MNTQMNLQRISVDKLKPAKYNPRKDLKPGDPAYEKIKRSLHDFGYVDPVIWNEVTGNIVGGHQRYKVLKAEGVTEIDCVVVHVENPQDEKALNVALNKAVGEWEPKALADLLQDLQLSGYDVGATGFDAAEVDDLFSKVHDKNVKDDDCDIDPEAMQPFVQPGDVWTLGRHRMVCGDSTNPDHVDLLMDGLKANLVVTDPPYNVAYESADGKSIQNDSMADEKFYEFLLAAFRNMAAHMAEGGSAYIFHADTLDANGITYDSVYARSSHVFLYNCGLYNALQGLECYLAQGNVKDCCGSCSWAMVSYASLIIASGTVPAGSRGTGENGLLYANSVTTDYGTAIPTVTPDETGILYATTTKSWRGSWRTDTLDVIQGVYYDSGYNSSLNWNRGCMWFSNAQNLLSGCTVKSATLTLHRKTGSGSSSAKSVYLCAITNTSASGAPSIARNYGAIGTIGRDKQVTFSIPVDAVQGLADGYYGGLCLYETPYNFGSSTYSNAYMRMSGTDTNYEPYIECVFSGSTAVG